jgi:hypothetical protein
MAQGLIRPDRLQIMLSPEELEAVDDFRFKRRMPSRASAIRELLKRGLATEGFEAAAAGRKSRSFGVLGADFNDTPKGRRQRRTDGELSQN